MSPFDYKILDIRTFGGSSNVSTVELVAKQEFFIYRIVFLIMGIVLLSLASRLSKSVAFYYIGAMSIGIVILVTLIINQGIKRLPTRGKSRFQLFFYSSMVRVVFSLSSFVEHVLTKAFFYILRLVWEVTFFNTYAV
jgi:hypothetical protein